MAHAIEAPAQSINAEGPTSHTPNQPANTFGYSREEQIEALRKLRDPFPATEIRHLPRIWCQTCKNSRGKGCDRHRFAKCPNCKQNMPQGGHIDLRYVGHAEATNRLLNVDPFWDWEPLTVDERGLPAADGYKGLWIRLTVCGMTRLGYGHAGDKTGGDAIKEVIGDAIRNAGMRFGMALDLWTTSDLEILESDGPSDDTQATAASAASARQPAAQPEPTRERQAPSRDEVLDKLYRQAIANRSHVDVLKQIAGAAKAEKVIDMEVDGPPPAHERMTLGALIDLLLADAQAANAERNAA
ncbi:hypothetical protein ACFVWR_18505 [Leifsonia sp. NPDC058292]|uniref:hypothetical protein n=1 Tax=Leifsonia sp. NPDC058292 TaxID=3346428 RepID=UPI0036D83B46